MKHTSPLYPTLALIAAGIAASGSAFAVQRVEAQNITRNGTPATVPLFIAAGDRIKFDAVLVDNGAQGSSGTGIGLCLEYKRSTTGDATLANLYNNGTLGNPTPSPDNVASCHIQPVSGSVQVPGSDTTIVAPWFAITANPGFPGVPLPVKLYDASFSIQQTPAGSAAVGFAASSVAAGESFSTNTPLTLCGMPTVTLNVLANGVEAGSVAAMIAVALSAPIPPECGTGIGFPVTLTLSGTATIPGQAGADYTIGGSRISSSGAVVTATFPTDGVTQSLTFSAKPVADGNPEPTETLTLTVAQGLGNYLGVGASATATITDAVAATATVVEYVDSVDFPISPGGHFFYSSDPAEQAAVDAGSAGSFFRTGRTFKTGGSAPVCRFYGSVTPGPNSHFFTVSPDECNSLKALQKTPTPTDIQQWNFERIEYNTTPPVPVNNTLTCPSGTIPVYRAYNNAFPTTGPKNPWDSNHRYSSNLADIAQMVGLGWRDEGLQFCTAQ